MTGSVHNAAFEKVPCCPLVQSSCKCTSSQLVQLIVVG
jgi:hypothetical protein